MSFWSDPVGSISGSLNDLGSSVSNFVKDPAGTVGSTLNHWGDVVQSPDFAQNALAAAALWYGGPLVADSVGLGSGAAGAGGVGSAAGAAGEAATAGAATDAAWGAVASPVSQGTLGGWGALDAGAGAGAAVPGAMDFGMGAGAGGGSMPAYMGVGSSLGAGAGAGLPIEPSMMQTIMGNISQGWGVAKPWLKGGSSAMQTLMGLQTMQAGRQRQAQQQRYGDQLESLMQNPGSVTGLPGYEAGMEAVRRSLAAQGYQGSGNMMAGLQKYGGDFYQQQLQNLAALQGTSSPMPSYATGATQFGAGLAGLAGL